MPTRASIRKRQKRAAKAAERQRAARRQLQKLAFHQVDPKDVKSCNEFYTMTLTSLRESLRINAAAAQAIEYFNIISNKIENEEVRKQVSQYWNEIRTIAGRIDTECFRTLLAAGKIEDTTSNYDRMQQMIAIFPTTRLVYNLTCALNRCISNLSKQQKAIIEDPTVPLTFEMESLQGIEEDNEYYRTVSEGILSSTATAMSVAELVNATGEIGDNLESIKDGLTAAAEVAQSTAELVAKEQTSPELSLVEPTSDEPEETPVEETVEPAVEVVQEEVQVVANEPEEVHNEETITPEPEQEIIPVESVVVENSQPVKE